MDDWGPTTELYALLCGLYLLECFRWVGRGSVCFRSVLPGRWALAPPWQVASQFRRVLVMTAPWPPLGALWVCEGWPVVCGPSGLTFAGRPAQGWSLPSLSAPHVAWSQLQRVSLRGAEVWVDGACVGALGSQAMASALRRLMREMGEARAKQRPALLEAFVRRRVDRDELRRRRHRWQRRSWPLIAACNALMLALFGGGWALLFTHVAHAWVTVLAVGLAFWLTTAALYVVTVRRVLPAQARPGLGRQLVTLLSPVSLVRGADDLRGELYGDCEPLALAAEYLAPADFQAYAGGLLRQWTWPVAAEGEAASGPAREDNRWLREQLCSLARELLKERKVDVEALLRPPLPEGGSEAFCPRCSTQYLRLEGGCASCPGIALKRFSVSAAARG